MNRLNKLIKEEFRLLLERTSEPQPFKRITNGYESITYEFFASDVRYEFNLTAKTQGHEVGTYEAVFIKDDQKSSADRDSKLGGFHFLKVLATCKAIMDIECKEKKIRRFAVEGAIDEETEKTLKRGDTEDNTQRARIYYDYFVGEYPNGVVSKSGRFIVLDMTKAFPDLFDVENSETSTVNALAKLLMRVSDKKPDANHIRQSFEGNEEKFSVSTDELENNQYGGLDLDVYVDNSGKYYKIDYSKFERGESGSEEFNDFKALTQFIQTRLFS